MKGVDPSWIRSMVKLIQEGGFKNIVLHYTPAIKWLICYMANKDTPVKVVNLGAGVKRITVVDNVCSHCKGKGYE